MSTYTWGTAAVAGKTGWLVQTANKNQSAQEALALDNSGEPVHAHYYQKINEMSFEVLIPAGDSGIPAIGDTFTYEGVGYYVTGVAEARSNTTYQRYTLTCKRFITANLPT